MADRRHAFSLTGRTWGMLLGLVAPVAFGLVLIPARTIIDNATVALGMVLVIVVAATLGGRLPALVTVVSSAVAFNLFHTRPHNRLVIEDPADVELALALLGIGLLVSELTTRLAHSRADLRHQRFEAARSYRVAHVAANQPVQRLVDVVCREIRGELSVESCRLVDGPADTDGAYITPEAELFVAADPQLGPRRRLQAGTLAVTLPNVDHHLRIQTRPGLVVTDEQLLTVATLAGILTVALRDPGSAGPAGRDRTGKQQARKGRR